MEDKIKTFLDEKFDISYYDPRFAEALKHKYNDTDSNNKRLAFLGDRVISLAIREYYYHNNPTDETGKLTKICSGMESKAYLAEKARKFELDKMLIGPNIPRDEGEDKTITEAFEAIIGVIYLIQGFEKAMALVKTHIIDERLLNRLIKEGRIEVNED